MRSKANPSMTVPMIDVVMEPLAVSIRDAAKLIGISERSIAQLVADGEIPSFKHGGRRLIDVNEIRRWVAGKSA